MQIKTLLHRTLEMELGNGQLTKKSVGPVCLTRALKNIYTYGFVKTPTAIVPLVKQYDLSKN